MSDTLTNPVFSAMEAAIQARVPIMLVGAPGTGKTATIKELAKKMEYELITLVGSQLDPTDIIGLPKPEKVMEKEDGSSIYGTTYLAPWWQIKILQNKKVILFLDEFSNTPGATRASMLTLLQNREFPNGEVMPDETIVIGAMNPAEQAADGYDLDLPTTNRLFFIPWSPTADSWYEGMLKAWGQKASSEELMWRQKIVKFIQDNPSWLHNEPANEVGTAAAYGITDSDPSKMEVLRSAWASRRTWDKLAQVLAFAPNDVYTQDLIAQGLVGYSAAADFRNWLRKNDVIDPRKVLDNPKRTNWEKISIDDSNLVLRAVLEMIDENPDLNAVKAIKVFEAIADADRTDLGASFMKELLTKTTSKTKISANVRKECMDLLKPLAYRYSNYQKKN